MDSKRKCSYDPSRYSIDATNLRMKLIALTLVLLVYCLQFFNGRHCNLLLEPPNFAEKINLLVLMKAVIIL